METVSIAFASYLHCINFIHLSSSGLSGPNIAILPQLLRMKELMLPVTSDSMQEGHVGVPTGTEISVTWLVCFPHMHSRLN